MTRTRFALVAAASAVLIGMVIAAAYISYFGLPSRIVSLLLRPITAPTSDEYAVYSTFIDNFVSTEQPFRADQSISDSNLILVADETLPYRANGSALPLDVVALGPEDMGKDFLRQNEQQWRLAEKLNTRIRTKLVSTALKREAAQYGTEELFASDGDNKKWLPRASPNGPFPQNPTVSGVLQLSRIGFDWRRRIALLYFDYRCGFLCGQSGWVALEKSNSRWMVQRYGAGKVY